MKHEASYRELGEGIADSLGLHGGLVRELGDDRRRSWSGRHFQGARLDSSAPLEGLPD